MTGGKHAGSAANDPLRVVHLINHLGRGGSERQLALLLSHLDPMLIRSTVVVFNPSHHAVWDRDLEAVGVTVVNLPEACRGIGRRLLYLRRLLREQRADVVHSWSVHDNPYAALAGRLAGVPVRWGSLRGSLHSEWMNRLPKLFRWLCVSGPDRLIVNAEVLVEQLVAAGRRRDTVEVLPNCAELPDRVSERATENSVDLSEFGIGPSDRLIGIVGNLRRVKNHRMFVRAMSRVLPTRPDCRAVLVGQPLDSEPEVTEEIERLINEFDLKDQVTILGFRSDVAAILDRLSILCLTSISEGMPNAVLEAMAAARPVVATRVGGVPELVDDGVTGHLVDLDDEAALATSVADLLDHPERAVKLGAAGRRRVEERHSCSVAAHRLADLYEHAVEQKGRR